MKWHVMFETQIENRMILVLSGMICYKPSAYINLTLAQRQRYSSYCKVVWKLNTFECDEVLELSRIFPFMVSDT